MSTKKSRSAKVCHSSAAIDNARKADNRTILNLSDQQTDNGKVMSIYTLLILQMH